MESEEKEREWYHNWWFGIIVLMILFIIGSMLPDSSLKAKNGEEPTKASQSSYNQNIFKATTSYGLTKADLAWHALNTYGWDCSEVVSVEEKVSDYYVIECLNGTRLRVYPRSNQHPKITNINGGYD